MTSFPFYDTLARALRDRNIQLITEYDLYFFSSQIIKTGKYQNDSVRWMPREWNVHALKLLLRQMQKRRVITEDPDFGSSTWIITGVSQGASAEEACCLVDPFCYVSHLSAMQRYNLTDRQPRELHITRPNAKVWRTNASAKLNKDIVSYEIEESPILKKIAFKPTIRNRPIKIFETTMPGISEDIAGEQTRISSIGTTFIDMLDQPNLCGGIRHVLEVWEEHASSWIEDIVATVERTPKRILKVRAGYILDERLGIKSPRILSWLSYAQRGGSSKLDPETEYKPTFSEKWMLSINV